MLSRENRVLAVAAVISLVGLGVWLAFEIDHVLVGVLVPVVIPILGPQLYLAVTDGDGEYALRTCVRTAALASLLLLVSFLAVTDGTDRAVVGVLAGVVVVGSLCYEGVSGYRRARDG